GGCGLGIHRPFATVSRRGTKRRGADVSTLAGGGLMAASAFLIDGAAYLDVRRCRRPGRFRRALSQLQIAGIADIGCVGRRNSPNRIGEEAPVEGRVQGRVYGCVTLRLIEQRQRVAPARSWAPSPSATIGRPAARETLIACAIASSLSSQVSMPWIEWPFRALR